jgi:hypothetical protein
VTIGNSLDTAVAASFGGQTQPPPPTGGGPPPTGSQVNQLLAQALQHFAAAEAALKQGDLATYQKEILAGEQLVAQARALEAQNTASPTPTPSASPS